MKTVVFITDRVMHYQVSTFRCLKERLEKADLDLVLLAGEGCEHPSGRVRTREEVIDRQLSFVLHERRIGGYTLRWYDGVIETLRQVRPDIVVNSAHPGNLSHWQLLRLKEELGFRLVSWLCGYEFNPGSIKKWVATRFIGAYDHHLAYHSNARLYALGHGARPDQITVIHNTIDERRVVRMDKAAARRALSERYPAIGDRKIVLFVGAVLAEKKLDVAIDAMRRVNGSDAVLVIVGDGEYMPLLRRRCEGRDDVILVGSIVEGVGIFFDAAALYVLPGTGGLGINEAMAHGLPIVSGYADGSADDLVRTGENGIRVRTVTANALAEAIRCVLADEALADRMGQRSLELITTNFSFLRFIDRVVVALQNIA